MLTHTILIGLAVLGTQPQSGTDGGQGSRIAYLPPPDPIVRRHPRREMLYFVEVASHVSTMTLADGPLAVDAPVVRLQGASTGPTASEMQSTDEENESSEQDSVFTIIEVDSAAARLPTSAAPEYPADLLSRGVEGATIVQFIVDTNGLADVSSFRIVSASHAQFAKSVEDALPGMRFTPGRIGTLRVRQLVELPFAFNIAKPQPALDSTTTPGAAAANRDFPVSVPFAAGND